jgi:hypothetical protein
MYKQQVFWIILVAGERQDTIRQTVIYVDAIDIRRISGLAQDFLNEEHAVGDSITISRRRVKLMNGSGMQTSSSFRYIWGS